MKRIVLRIKFTLYKAFLKIKYAQNITIGKGFSFRKHLNINLNGGRLIIGDNVFLNNYCSINVHKEILIGNNCIFGENVKMYDHNHKYKDKNDIIRNQGYSYGKIIIGDNCWIGSNVVILKGVNIGNNVIIGANCVIYKSIPDNCVVKNSCNLEINEY